MNIIEIIEAKKEGKELSKEQIEFWIDNLMKGTIEDYQTSALLMAICLKGFNDDESVYLTQAMLNSGSKLDLSCFGDKSIDKHSSGGVGDSTSFIVIPILAALGYKCAKASGRGLGHTGGTLDKLESIKGLRIGLSKQEFFDQVKNIGLAIVGQSADICPADKKLYALRDVTATVSNIGLISSSIMSKKLASGAKNIVLDVKCGRGAFMKDESSAIELARRMVAIGKKMDKNITAVVTNMDYPLDNYIGNSLEILGALKVLKGEINNLYEVSITLSSVLLESMGVKDAKEKCIEVIKNGQALEKFRQMIAYQGGDVSYIDDDSNLINAKTVLEVVSNEDGYVVDIDPIKIAHSVQLMGGGRLKTTDSIDLYCGLKINKNINNKINKGESLATLYVNNGDIDQIYACVLDAFKIAKAPIQEPKMILKIINNI